LAPLLMAIRPRSRIFSRAAYFFSPAMPTAPDGSVMARVSSKISLIAAQISSVSTVMTSSSSSAHRRKVSAPAWRTATPSANSPT
jgi:hypothetical protein